jgi:hypothetical protein
MRIRSNVMSQTTDGSPPGNSKSVINALEVLHNCVYLVANRQDLESRRLAEYMTSALDVVTPFIVDKGWK